MDETIRLAFDDVERLADELRLARELQQSMLPKQPPMLDAFEIAAAWLPANEMSGDFYDFILVDPDRHGIVLADVAGKGMPAAMVMTLMRSALRMALKSTSSPISVLTALNQQLLRDVTQRRPVSLIYAILDAYQQTLTLVNAGGPYPLMLTAEGQCVEIEVGGYPLGSARTGFDYVESVIELPSNSAIVLFSDGIDEARNAAGEAYGFYRLPSVVSGNASLSAKDLADVLLDDVLTYARHVRNDDMTLVVIKAKEAIGREHQKENRAYQLVPDSLRQQIRNVQGKIEGEKRVVTLLNVEFSQSRPSASSQKDSFQLSAVGARHASPLLAVGSEANAKLRAGLMMTTKSPTQQATETAQNPEAFRAAVNAVAQIIFDHEGLANRISRTEMAGFFGAPLKHTEGAEDAAKESTGMALCAADAMRAVQAAAEIRDVAQTTHGLSVRIGLHTGAVVVSDISDEAVEYAQVEPLFRAVRAIMAQARHGGISVDETTYRLTRSRYNYSLLPVVEVEWRRQPIQPYQLIGLQPPSVSKRIDGSQHNTQFRQLETWAEALIQRGQGRVISIVGSSGVGKNPLLTRFKSRIGNQVEWVTSCCVREQRQSSYAVFVPVLQCLLDIDATVPPLASTTSLRTTLQALYSEAPFDPVFPVDEMQAYLESLLFVEKPLDECITHLSAEQLQRQTFVAIRDLLRMAAHRKPIVIDLDGLPWIDDVSKRLITFLLDLFLEAPIMLLCLSHSPDWWLREHAMSVIPERYESVTLHWMSLEESRQLVDDLLPGVPDELKTLILRRGAGNPFHISQIVKLLIADGVVIQNDGLWLVTTELGDVSLPTTLEGILRARIDRLNFNAREILQYAAVLGAAANLTRLWKMADLIPHLDHHLQHLQELGFIQYQASDGKPRYRLEREMIANIVYAGIPKQERMAHHDWIAHTLENERSGRLVEADELLAFHYLRGNESEKAIEYLLKAGHWARQYANYADAVAFYEQASELLRDSGDDDPERQWEIEEGLGDVFHAIGRYNDALGSYRKLLDLSLGEGPPARFAQGDIQHRMAETYMRQNAWAKALETLLSAKTALETLDDTSQMPAAAELLGEVYHHIGYVHSRRGDVSAAIEAGRHALDILPTNATADLHARVHGRLGSYYTETGNLKAAEEQLKASIGYAERIGNQHLLSVFYNDLGVIARASNQLDFAVECYQKSVRFKKQMRYLDTLPRSYVTLAQVYLEIGDTENARLHLHYGLSAIKPGSQTKLAGDIHVNLGRIYQQQGRIDEAIEHYTQNAELRLRTNDEVGYAFAQAYLHDGYLAKADYPAAMTAAEASLKSAEPLNLEPLVAQNYMNLADLHRRANQWETALENLEIGLVVAERAGEEKLVGQIHQRLGELYLGSANNAYLVRTHFFEAITVFEEIGADEEAEAVRRIMAHRRLI